jgi:uncharacterized protein
MSASTNKNGDDKLVRLRPSRPCPICGKAATREAWPFCSRRCADVDLNRWLSGSYRIPGPSAESEQPPDEDTEGGEGPR